MTDIEELKEMADPFTKLYNEQVKTNELLKDQIAKTIKNNTLLGQQVDEAKKTNKYKKEQKYGDIKYRTHDMRIKKQSTHLNVFGLFMAGFALAISIAANGIQPLIIMITGI